VREWYNGLRSGAGDGAGGTRCHFDGRLVRYNATEKLSGIKWQGWVSVHIDWFFCSDIGGCSARRLGLFHSDADSKQKLNDDSTYWQAALCAAELVDDLPEGWSQPCYRIVIKPTDEGDGPEAAEPECEKKFHTYDIAHLSELFKNTMQLYT